MFVFSNIKNSEEVIRKTWKNFRDALSKGLFKYNEIEEAKKCKF